MGSRGLCALALLLGQSARARSLSILIGIALLGNLLFLIGNSSLLGNHIYNPYWILIGCSLQAFSPDKGTPRLIGCGVKGAPRDAAYRAFLMRGPTYGRPPYIVCHTIEMARFARGTPPRAPNDGRGFPQLVRSCHVH